MQRMVNNPKTGLYMCQLINLQI